MVGSDELPDGTETEKAKLERKRKQQQKKDEFLAQLKRRRADEPGEPFKTEPASPVPEGQHPSTAVSYIKPNKF